MRLAAAFAIALAAVIGQADPAASQNRSLRAPSEWAKRTVALDALTLSGRRIASDDTGMVQVLLADGTTFTLAPDSEIVVDSFVYDPAAGTSRVAASMRRGTARFVGGKTTADGVSIDTPFGTLHVDRAMADIALSGTANAPHFDMIFGNAMTLQHGGTVLARIFKPGYSIVPAADGRSAKVRKTPAEWKTSIQERLSAPRR
jgi:hypothetical protein